MRIFYVTTQHPGLQGDLQEVSMLIGLRQIMGADVIDVPRKKVMYGDFSNSPKNGLHGWGFTYFNRPIAEAADYDVLPTKDDVVLYGVTNSYGVADMPELNDRARAVFYLDGRDPMRVDRFPCFKRELSTEDAIQHKGNIKPTGFGMPDHMIRPIDLTIKDQLHQKTWPKKIIDPNHREPDTSHYLFIDETEYYDDMARSWFGLSCKKGGWDCLRHYEILAAGSVLMIKDVDQKPPECSPQHLQPLSYSSYEEAVDIMNGLVVDGRPTQEYLRILSEQRGALRTTSTCAVRAQRLVQDIKSYLTGGWS